MDRPALPKEDLFEASTMTFGEHLEELRKALARALVWWAAGALIAFVFIAQPVIRWIQEPLQQAIIEYKADRGIAKYNEDQNIDEKAEEEKLQRLKDLMLERGLSWEQVWVTSKSQWISQDALESLDRTSNAGPSDSDATQEGQSLTEGPSEGSSEIPKDVSIDQAANGPPAASLVPDPTDMKPVWILRPTEASLNSHKVEEPFMIYLKAAIVVGSLLASPMIFYHLWSFVAAGLYPHERRYVYVYLPFSVTLFISGVSLAFFAVLGFVLKFLLDFNSSLSVDMEPRLSYYMNFVLLLPLGFGIAFQLPLVMLFLQRIGIFETSAYEKSWRISVLVIAFLSMVLTPADPYSMILLMIPLVLLYFLGIALCRFMPRGRGLGSAAYDPR